jgi:hypothetical protein
VRIRAFQVPIRANPLSKFQCGFVRFKSQFARIRCLHFIRVRVRVMQMFGHPRYHAMERELRAADVIFVILAYALVLRYCWTSARSRDSAGVLVVQYVRNQRLANHPGLISKLRLCYSSATVQAQFATNTPTADRDISGPSRGRQRTSHSLRPNPPHAMVRQRLQHGKTKRPRAIQKQPQLLRLLAASSYLRHL